MYHISHLQHMPPGWGISCMGSGLPGMRLAPGSACEHAAGTPLIALNHHSSVICGKDCQAVARSSTSHCCLHQLLSMRLCGCSVGAHGTAGGSAVLRKGRTWRYSAGGWVACHCRCSLSAQVQGATAGECLLVPPCVHPIGCSNTFRCGLSASGRGSGGGGALQPLYTRARQGSTPAQPCPIPHPHRPGCLACRLGTHMREPAPSTHMPHACVQVVPMLNGRQGTWTLSCPAEWLWGYYTYRVTVFSPLTVRIEVGGGRRERRGAARAAAPPPDSRACMPRACVQHGGGRAFFER